MHGFYGTHTHSWQQIAGRIEASLDCIKAICEGLARFKDQILSVSTHWVY